MPAADKLYPVKAIAAVGENGVMGRQGQLPWRIPAELNWFKEKTESHVVLFGRKTFEGFTRPLSRRDHWVLSRQNALLTSASMDADSNVNWDVHWLPNLESFEAKAMGFPKEESRRRKKERASKPQQKSGKQADRSIWICGGLEIYKQFLPRCTELYLSIVKGEFEGDCHFPNFEHLFKQRVLLKEDAAFSVYQYFNPEPKRLA